MIRVHTPSRLHFGLFSLPRKGEATLPRRSFGGVGLMIDKPGIVLTAEFAQTWHAEGPLLQRALSYAQSFCAMLGIQEAFHLRIESAAPEHAGLGTGTQLGLAVARAIADLTQQPACDAVTLAKQVGRGLRSAIGLHGFDRGGFLIEGGKTSDTAISPLLVHHDFPDDWRILLIRPRDLEGAHGRCEIEAFSTLAMQKADDRCTETLCRIALLGMVPALAERDADNFGEAIYDFNRRVGEWFQVAQGGIYAHPRIDEIVKVVRAAGTKGVGQSSWGPTVFAVVPGGEATDLRDWLVERKVCTREEVMIASASRRGVVVGA